MRFLGIYASEREVRPVDGKDANDATRRVGLHPHRTDHGVVFRTSMIGVGIIVYEWSLMLPPTKQQYYSLRGRLYCGNALLYGFDMQGVTVDIMIDIPIRPRWFESIAEIEEAIAAGVIRRPINDMLGWSWPQPPNAEVSALMERHRNDV